MTISSLENSLLIIYFIYPNLVICIGQFELCNTFGPIQSIWRVFQQGQQVAILDSKIDESLIIKTCLETAILLLNKEDESVYRQFKSHNKIISYVDFNIRSEKL